ncbi:hypothetical protein EI94DRAFT_1695901 [Lactarius quietus]|nr:hypothetical protein EI94DRAFT_1695901 [Lactarius quietus]
MTTVITAPLSPTTNSGPSDNLFAHIDRDNVVALNSVHGGSEVIKPWDERMDEQVASYHPTREIPTLESSRRSTPAKVALFANVDNFDFDDSSDKEPLQELDVAVGCEVGAYAVNLAGTTSKLTFS